MIRILRNSLLANEVFKLTAFGGTLSDGWHAQVLLSMFAFVSSIYFPMAKKSWPCRPNTISYALNRMRLRSRIVNLIFQVADLCDPGSFFRPLSFRFGPL